MDNNKLGFVVASKYRKYIVKILLESEKTPKELSELSDTSLPHISGLLRDLNDKNIIKCQNPDMRKGRLYTLTKTGRKIAEKIQ